MTDAASPEGDPQDLAAELALGVLDAADRAAAERRVLADLHFAGQVEAWSHRLAKLTEEAPSREPPARVWPRVEAGLGSAIADGTNVVELGLRRSLTVWRSVAAGAGAIAAGLAVVLLLPHPAPPTPAAPTVAVAPAGAVLETASLSTATGGKIAFVAIYDVERHELVLTPASIGTTPGRSPELWVIPTGGKPISLGVGQFGKPVRLKVDALAGSTLAVSLEPLGGSPTGQPTGPVVATGQLRTL